MGTEKITRTTKPLKTSVDELLIWYLQKIEGSYKFAHHR